MWVRRPGPGITYRLWSGARAADYIITTSGVDRVECRQSIGPQAIRPGDRLMVSGDLGRHGLELQPPVESDCAPLWLAVKTLL